MGVEFCEKRRCERVRRTEAILWRHPEGGEDAIACLLESSDDGLAFAWRGEDVPRPGQFLDVERYGPDQARDRVVVRWSRLAHEDLIVAGAEIWRGGTFPPEAEAAVKPSGRFTPEEIEQISLSWSS